MTFCVDFFVQALIKHLIGFEIRTRQDGTLLNIEITLFNNIGISLARTGSKYHVLRHGWQLSCKSAGTELLAAIAAACMVQTEYCQRPETASNY